MNGVEILSSKQVAIAWEYNWTAFWIAFALICFVAVLVGIAKSIDSCDWTYLIACAVIGIIIGAFLAAMIGDMTNIPIKYTNQYKVTISDEVLMNEFTEKYDIISQEGRIYTVREKIDEITEKIGE